MAQISSPEERATEKSQDRWEEQILDEVDGPDEDGHYGLGFHQAFRPDDRPGSSGVSIRWREGLRPPRVGDRFRLYGIFGERIRGADWLIDDNWVEVWYSTEAERELEAQEWSRQARAKKEAEYESKKDEYAQRIADLPPAMQERIENFRKVRPDFDIEALPYELFTIEEAVKLARAIPGIDDPNVANGFRDASIEDQKKRVPSLAYGEHSGNTFGMAVSFAHRLVWAEQSKAYDIISQYHGAMVGIEGCEGAGCAKFDSHRKAKE